MNPLGMALTFVALWLIIGLGAFLFFNTLSAFFKHMRAGEVLGLLPTAKLPSSLSILVDFTLLFMGMAMMVAGLYASYVVIYR